MATKVASQDVANSFEIEATLLRQRIKTQFSDARPVVSTGNQGSGRGEFISSWGVVVEHKSENLYVADQCNQRVQVFTREAKYLFEFGSDKMEYLLCVVIYKDRVFVTQTGGSYLLVYDLNGKFIQQVGTPGSKEGQVNHPYGIAICPINGDVYICDYFNNRIQIFSNNYSYKSQFGMSILKHPTDIQLTKDTIFVLSYQNPFLYSFNYDLTQLHNTVCDSICKYLAGPFSFIIVIAIIAYFHIILLCTYLSVVH